MYQLILIVVLFLIVMYLLYQNYTIQREIYKIKNSFDELNNFLDLSIKKTKPKVLDTLSSINTTDITDNIITYSNDVKRAKIETSANSETNKDENKSKKIVPSKNTNDLKVIQEKINLIKLNKNTKNEENKEDDDEDDGEDDEDDEDDEDNEEGEGEDDEEDEEDGENEIEIIKDINNLTESLNDEDIVDDENAVDDEEVDYKNIVNNIKYAINMERSNNRENEPTFEIINESERVESEKVESEKVESEKVASEKVASEKVASEKVASEKVASEKVASEKVASEKVASEKLASKKLAPEKIEIEKIESEKVSSDKKKLSPLDFSTKKAELNKSNLNNIKTEAKKYNITLSINGKPKSKDQLINEIIQHIN